jgi:hypothetical protein
MLIDNKSLREEIYVVVSHHRCLRENQLNLQDNVHDLFVNYHPIEILLMNKIDFVFKFTLIS